MLQSIVHIALVVRDYGTVAVFKDLHGNLWDLVQFNKEHPMSKRVK
ncbi:hypothetical protein [Clostridium fungisolvens]|uniref:Uncharacterized protein n=1 Tax=Clostridium fungisolvens TaxID=1604897 RepID=A0A6V8SEH7_9CLOT|nr:hypothetical protein [Clostridium fungisolvens]GFP75470.1 hypothetical protein bsdtw1_01550 [Clostridium fungisolvens]